MKTTTTSSRTCGFCETSTHQHCPGAVTNGNGSLLVCPCEEPGCGQDKHYCKTCGAREEVQGWKCLDRDACQARFQAEMDAGARRLGLHLGRTILGRSGDSGAPAARPRAPRPEKAPSKARDCTCGCGGQTKGGKFLPGHDSRYLSALVAEFDADQAAVRPSTARDQAFEVSEAFGQKFNKRVGA